MNWKEMNEDLESWKHIYWYSGGKDSTAMMLLAIKEKWKIDKILFFDNGILHPEAYKALFKLGPMMPDGIIAIKPKRSFEYMLTERVVKKSGGDTVKGSGWPTRGLGWCCRWGQNVIRKYESVMRPYIEMQAVIVGDSVETPAKASCHWRIVKYPLLERKLSAEDTLEICKAHGFDFGGYYDRGNRHLSCQFCPYQHMGEFQRLYQEDKEGWEKLKRLDTLSHSANASAYRKGKSVQEYEDKFIRDAQGDSGIDERQFELEIIK